MESVQKSTNQLHNNTSASQTRVPLTKSGPVNEQMTFTTNDIIKGLVVDLRPGLITLKLKNQQTIQGEYTGNQEVSIGDVASFRIVKEGKDGPVLTRLNPSISAQNNTIYKALDNAGLPANETNMEIVRELLNFGLPINKESIMYLIKQSHQFKDASLNTLVFMIKNGLPLTSSTVTQMEQFRHNEHRIVNQLSTISENLCDSLASCAKYGEASTLLNISDKLMQFLFPKDGLTSQAKTTLLPELIPYLQGTDQIPYADLTGEQQTELLGLFSSLEVSEEMITAITNNEVALPSVIHALVENMAALYPITKESLLPFETDVVYSLLDQLTHTNESLNQLSHIDASSSPLHSILNSKDRIALLPAIHGLDLTNEQIKELITGTMTTNTLLELVAKHLTFHDQQTIRSIMKERPFLDVLKYKLSEHLLLTPNEVANKENALEYYNHLYEKLDTLKEMLNGFTNSSFINANTQATAIQENLNFMHMLNQMYTCLQLPLKLSEQNAHGDLYVYTNKKNLKNDPSLISVLLHLDMENLGQTDIHITLQNKSIQTRFYLESPESLSIISLESARLKERFKELGFTLNIETHLQKNDHDPINDVFLKEQQTTLIKRYSFDIRA